MDLDDKLKQAIALGREHYEKREYDKAEHYLLKVLAQGGNRFADVHNMMGVIHHDKGRLEEAREEFKRALEQNPKYDKAQQVYRGALAKDTRGPDDIDSFAKGKIANLHAELAQAYLDVNMPNEAVQEYRDAIRLCPHFADLRVRLANVYRQINDLVAARYELEEAMRVRPLYNPARVAMGVLLLVTGQRQKALEQWEEALRIEPENKAAQMYMRMAAHPSAVSDRPR
jgi:tetratricopeptide (TPR) repeat protein